MVLQLESLVETTVLVTFVNVPSPWFMWISFSHPSLATTI